MARKRGGGKNTWEKKVTLVRLRSYIVLLTLPAGGLPQAQLPAGIAGVKRGLVNIYIINCYFYSRIPPLAQEDTRVV